MISVLLPVKNAAQTLEACLKSLEDQTLKDFEIVAVDHDSSDDSTRILRRHKAQNPKLKIIGSSAPSLPAALNEGLAACKGDLVARMDADDLSMPHRLEAQADFLGRNANVGVVGCWIEVFSDGGEVSEGYQEYEYWANSLVDDFDIKRELFIECPLPHPSWMVRKSVYDKLGGYRDNGLPEDYDFLLRAAEANVGMGKVEEVLLAWRDHENRHSRSHERYGRQPFMRLRAKYLKSILIKKSPCVLWGAGDRGRLLARCLMDEGVKIEVVVGMSEKENPPSSVHGVKVIAPEALPKILPGPIIACVGAPGAREEIRKWMKPRNLLEGKDYWFAS